MTTKLPARLASKTTYESRLASEKPTSRVGSGTQRDETSGEDNIRRDTHANLGQLLDTSIRHSASYWKTAPQLFKWVIASGVTLGFISHLRQALLKTRVGAEQATARALRSQLSALQQNLRLCGAYSTNQQSHNSHNNASLETAMRDPGLLITDLHTAHSWASSDWFLRLIAVFVLGGILWAAYTVFQRADCLPSTVKHLILSRIPSYDVSHPASLSKWIAYSLDHWFSTNVYSKTSSLLYVTLSLILMGSLAIFSVTHSSMYSAFWQAVEGVGINWTFADEKNSPWGNLLVRIIAVMLSIGGMLITALLLSIVSESISARIESLKKGHSDVLETRHTLILGWSDKVLGLVDQLCMANASEGGRPIVILAERDKLEMEASIRQHTKDTQGSRIICRNGNPLLGNDLERVSLQTARCTIIVASADTPDRSDARVLRIVLSLIGFHDKLQKAEGSGLLGHIVVEVCSLDNEALIQMVSPQKIHTVVSHDIIGRLMIQCARQPGLAAVWEVIMGFEDDEFYAREWPELEGKMWAEVLLRFPLAIPLGVQRKDRVFLNPHPDYHLKKGDRVIVLAEDDDSYEPCGSYPLLTCSPAKLPEPSLDRVPEKVLFCGWRRDVNDMINVLDEFVSPGSELWLYTDIPVSERLKLLAKSGLHPNDLKNLKLVFDEQKTEGELVNRRHLESLNPAQFSSILLLADISDSSNMTDADSRNLATLLLLRDIQAQALGLIPARSRGKKLQAPTLKKAASQLNRFKSLASLSSFRESLSSPKAAEWYDLMQDAVQNTLIISEILDPRTRNLIKDLHVSEYVLSNEIVSMALAMVAEGPEVLQILAELFVAEGNEFYIQPIQQYVFPDEGVNFYEIMERAHRRGEIAVGYRLRAQGLSPVINPKNKDEVVINSLAVESIVVIARGDE